MKRALIELRLFFHKVWNCVPVLPAFISVPLFNTDLWESIPYVVWYAFEPLLARFLGLKRY